MGGDIPCGVWDMAGLMGWVDGGRKGGMMEMK